MFSIRTLLLSLGLWVVSLVVGAVALLLANFGAPVWVFVVLIAWLLTVGLPTTLAVVLLAWVWSGLPLGLFLAAGALLALVTQTAAVTTIARLLARRRSRRMA